LSSNIGPFGRGGNHNYGYSLDTGTPQTAAVINLITPEWSRIPFARQGAQLTNASLLLGAVMLTGGNNRVTIRFKDGTIWAFSAPTPQAFPWLESITDANGNSVVITRDSARPAKITQITDPVGRSLVLTSDPQDRITSVTDPIGRVVSYAYNALGALATVTDPEGGITKYEYGAADRLTREIDARNVVVMENTFDANGRIVQQKHADGGVHLMAYTLLNPTAPASPVIQTIVTDPMGRQTTYRFNPEQHLTDVTDPLGQPRIFERKAGSNLISTIKGGGGCATCGSPGAGDVSFTYDDATGNVLSQTDALGRATRYTYETSFNKLESITDPLNNVTRFEYDSRGNLVRRNDANSNPTSYIYNAFGLMVEAMDASNNKTRYEYDGSGNLISITDATNMRTRFQYDAISRQVAVKDSLERTTSTLYDKLDRVIRQTDGKGGVTQLGHDEAHNLTSITDARVKQTRLVFDGMNRLLMRTTPLNKSESRIYDFNGNLIKYVDRRGQVTTFTYDAKDRLAIETYQDSTVTRFYDHAGRLVRVDDSLGGTFHFEYDLTGVLLGSVGPAGTVIYTRDELGRVKTRQVVGAPTVIYSYDRAGNLASAAMPQASVEYVYESRNLPQALIRHNGVSTNYQYDQVGRLLAITHNRAATEVAALKYSYDVSGQRVSQSTVGQSLTTQSAIASYDDGNRLLTRAGSNFTYDENGNVTSELTVSGIITYTWDSRNRLQSIASPSQTSGLIYDFAGNLRQQVDIGAINRTRTVVVDDLTNIAQLDGNSVLTGRAIDEHLAVSQGGAGVEYALTDAINSSIATVDEAGSIKGRFMYEPFGQTTAIATSYPLQFTGRVLISSDQYYYRTRYYDSKVGRFNSEDTIRSLQALEQFPGVSDLYVYVANIPSMRSDPLGLDKRGCDNYGPWNNCSLDCCRDHDACFARNHCVGLSHIWLFQTEECRRCNTDVYRCLAPCGSGQLRITFSCKLFDGKVVGR
jgi:RHS repeat-associated protein